MTASAALYRISRGLAARCHRPLLASTQRGVPSSLRPPLPTSPFPYGASPANRHVQHLAGRRLQQFGFSSSSSPQPNEVSRLSNEQGAQSGVSQNASKEEVDAETSQLDAKKENTTSSSSSSSSESETSEEDADLSIDDLVKLVDEKEELLKAKHKEIEKMQEKVLRSYAEVENVIDRTKREAENSKKFAIQNFAKSLLDVADNLGRASSVVKDSLSKIDQPKDTGEALPLLKMLLKGVEMTDKQLTDVFKKFGVEKFDPSGEHFDPHRHHAVFQMPSASDPPGTVTAVLKSGYMLYDRVIRPAEVGVTEAVKDEPEQSSEK